MPAALPPVKAVHWVVLRCCARHTLVRWIDGCWNGLSMQQVEHMRYQGQWLGDPLAIMSQEVYEFVFVERGVERALEPLNIPLSCGVPNGGGTCGVDVAVVRGPTGALHVRVMELNARTTMSHYAIAAKARVPRAVRFEVLRLSELEEIKQRASGDDGNILCLTDPETALMFCAVLHLQPRE